MSEPLEITAMTPETIAKLLSASYRRVITAAQIHEIAEKGNLISATGTVNLIHLAAWLAKTTTQDGD